MVTNINVNPAPVWGGIFLSHAVRVGTYLSEDPNGTFGNIGSPQYIYTYLMV